MGLLREDPDLRPEKTIPIGYLNAFGRLPISSPMARQRETTWSAPSFPEVNEIAIQARCIIIFSVPLPLPTNTFTAARIFRHGCTSMTMILHRCVYKFMRVGKGQYLHGSSMRAVTLRKSEGSFFSASRQLDFFP